jgi:hypothetical protein
LSRRYAHVPAVYFGEGLSSKIYKLVKRLFGYVLVVPPCVKMKSLPLELAFQLPEQYGPLYDVSYEMGFGGFL